MFIIIQMYSKLKRVHTTVFIYFFDIDFQRSKGGSTFSENKSKLQIYFVRNIFNEKMWQEWE